MKKAISLLLALSLALAVPAFAAGQTFTDVPQGEWYHAQVTRAAQQGWVNGVGGGRYEPDKPVTHSQFAVMLDQALYAGDLAAQPAGAAWWTAACEVADRHGLFKDTDMANRGSWNAVANTPIEREQMAQMMYNALTDTGAELPGYEEYSEAALSINDFIDVENDDAVAVCYALKLLSGNGNGYFDPHSPMTRAQAAVVLCNISDYASGSGKPVTPEPEKPDTPRPAGAVGGQYDVSVYDVPADTNKDGWITEAEVQKVLNQLRIDYPDGSPWGSDDHWFSSVLGNGWECAGFAYMVSDKIFGNLPAYEVQIEGTRVGDVMKNGPGNHKSIVLNDYGKAVYEGNIYPEQYYTVDGNVGGKVGWDIVKRYSEWPTGTSGTAIYSRYPKEN